MAFAELPFRGAMLIMLDGSDPKSAPRVQCERCSRPKLRVFFTAGLRRADPTFPSHQDVCITAKWVGPIPCPRALEAKELIDRLMEASRR